MKDVDVTRHDAGMPGTPRDLASGGRRWLAFRLLWIAAALLLASGLALWLDMSLARWVQRQGIPGDVHRSLMVTEAFAQGFGIAVILLTVAVLDPARRSGWPWWIACAYGPGIPVHFLKQSIGRSRPSASELGGPVRDTFVGWFPAWTGVEGADVWGSQWQSFPSGHAASAAGLAVLLSCLYPRGRWLFLALAVLAALQRVGSQAHFLSDVLAGAAIGCVTAAGVCDLAGVRLRRLADRKICGQEDIDAGSIGGGGRKSGKDGGQNYGG